MSINYSPAQIGEALGQIETNRSVFMDGAERIQQLNRELETSSGMAIDAARDAQAQAQTLRTQTDENVRQVKAEAQRSLERVQEDDRAAAGQLG
ncbi:hypothetical protein [Rhodococcus qingshengii]|uniref:hypothetical protein n=1 Tax=Rhodococcus qingshengii TaxID=334542 RepID=UPI0021B1185F|nr:hypothetical protein [Rhodococcus qingshengii]MCT6735356.1 hypothetical protein [Rhodococcus qingshengii]